MAILLKLLLTDVPFTFQNVCNRNLAWFKEAKESQGSVSARSFIEAKNANTNGKYLVGLQGRFEDFLQQTVTLHHVISLEVTYYDGKKGNKLKKRTKILTLDGIHDLQSRLMLLGRENTKNPEGHARDETSFEKDYFVQVFFVYLIDFRMLNLTYTLFLQEN